MKKITFVLIFGLFLVLVISIYAFSKPDTDRVPVNVKPSQKAVIIPEQAVEVFPDVFDLGTAEVNGEVLQGFMFLKRKDREAKANSKGGGTKNSACFAYQSQGARWKNTETYILDTANADGMTDAFVTENTAMSLDAWDSQVTFKIFGERNASAAVDGADTSSPDGKNEIFFGDIASPGVIASTTVWGVFAGPPSGRKLVEFDAVFDDVDYFWGDAGPTSETTLGNTSIMDYQNVAVHEFGHAAGMAHPSDSCTEESEYRFTTEGETKKRTLNPGDIGGIKGLYK